MGTLTLIGMVIKRLTFINAPGPLRTTRQGSLFRVQIAPQLLGGCICVASGGAALAVDRDPLREAFQAHWPADGIALRDIASELNEDVESVVVLDAFRDDLSVERVREPDRRLNHQAVAPVVDDSFDEALIDLDLIRRNLSVWYC